jgi:hypothetical protein
MRSGNYKLVVGPKGGEYQASWYGWFTPNQTNPNPDVNIFACGNDVAPGGCLFDVSVDPTEHNDIAAQQPALFSSLLASFRAYDGSYHPPANSPPRDREGLCNEAIKTSGCVCVCVFVCVCACAGVCVCVCV